MALTKVITGVTDLNQAQSTNGLKFPTGGVFAGTPEQGMIRNDQSQSSETSSSTMQFYNGTAWKNFVNKTPIPLGSDNFNTVIWNGAVGSGSRDFSGVGFQPDLVWAKRTSSVDDHHIYDSVRGAGATKVLASNKTTAEPANASATYGYLDDFLLDGFSTVSGSANNAFFNENNQSFVAWNWKAGGPAVQNNDGTITSQVSANTAAGFSIVQYTAGGAANVGHGLDYAPELIITKNIDASEQWFVYSAATGLQKFLGLNTTTAATSNSGVYTSVTDTTFTNNISSTSRTYINYCFHSVAGYSKIGSYTGDNQGTKQITQVGFTPSFVMIKSVTAGSYQAYQGWMMFDNKRNFTQTNPSDPGANLIANDSYQEGTRGNGASGLATNISFDSDGFTLSRPTSYSVEVNESPLTYIYLAIA